MVDAAGVAVVCRMKVLVTGGTGVVGAAAVPALLRAGHTVRLLSRHADRDVAELPEGVEAFVADLADPRPLQEAVAGCDAVVHIAGIVEEAPPAVTFEAINVEGTRALCAAAEVMGMPRFVYVSSLGADRGESDYHKSKLAAEEHVRRYRGPWVVLRPGAVYGPGDETVSMLLKMTRTLPAVPVVGDGEQPFQPIWYADFGEAIARTIDRPELAGRTLEVAGPDVTTTGEVLERLSAITGRKPGRISVPAWVARFGAQALESFGGLGRKLMTRATMAPPINDAKLKMLLEGNVIAEPKDNALTSVFGVHPTRLEDGLKLLADLLPEQAPGDGVGAVRRTTYTAEIRGSRVDAAGLVDLVCSRLAEIMPIEFKAEPGVPDGARRTGETLTGALPARGNIQVRLEERTERRASFVTIEGHPLAGLLMFTADEVPGGVRFSIEVAAQAANFADWIAMRTVGGFMQARNWREVVQRVVDASGGEAPAGVQRQSEYLDDEQVAQLHERVRATVARRKRDEAAAMAVAAAGR